MESKLSYTVVRPPGLNNGKQNYFSRIYGSPQFSSRKNKSREISNQERNKQQQKPNELSEE